VEPGLKTAPTSYTIQHFRADHILNDINEGYSAVSYTWGSSNAAGMLKQQGVAI
jgi:hypothetical protein